MVRFKFYVGECKPQGSLLIACRIGATTVGAAYPLSEDCPLDLPKCYKQVHKQCVKAHILEVAPDPCSQELYQAVVHVAEGVGLKARVKPKDMGRYVNLQDFITKVANV